MLRTQALPIKLANHFGNVEIKATIDDLRELGIDYGDSVSVDFSNGFSYHDIPYYNSFLGPGDKPCLYGIAEAYDYIGIGYPVAGNPWSECGATDTDNAIVRLYKKGKYADELNAYGTTIHPTPNVGMTVAEFANFRPLAIEGNSSDMLFRCANPLRSDTHCSHQAMGCIEDLQPNLIINLSDTPERIDSYCQENPNSHYARLRKANAVIAPRLGVDFTSLPFAQKVAAALSELVEHSGPHLIHCRYGVDRTGFVCILLEAIAGTPRHEIARDYMASYENVYGTPAQSEKYHAIEQRRFGEIESYLSSLGSTSARSVQDALADGAMHFLLKGGMKSQTLEKLRLLLQQ